LLAAIASDDSEPDRCDLVGLVGTVTDMASSRPLLARTSTEAHLYLDLHPCECGESSLPWASSVIELDEEDLGSRYDGPCPSCGTHREFTFRLPAELVLPKPGQIVYGDSTPSELLDPGEWMWVADRYSGSVKADTSGLDEAERLQARMRVSAAAAAMDEVLKFVPIGADWVPPEMFRTEVGRAMYDDMSGRFDRPRLEVVRDTYRQIIEEIDALR
jgi:hypothetical protein